MKKSVLAIAALSLISAPAFAKKAPATPAVTTIQCDQTPKSGKYFERLILQIDDQNNLISAKDLNWDAKKNQEEGTFDGYYDEKVSLAPEIKDGNLVYTYSTQDDGDGDYYHSNDLILTVPAKLKGQATLSNAQTNYSPDVEDPTPDDPEVTTFNCTIQ